MSRTEIVSIARRIVAKEIDPLLGCRLIVRHQGSLLDVERQDPSLLVLVGVESETDHFPLGEVRSHWDPSALAQQDRQRAEYLQRVEKDVLDACRAIIVKYS